MPPTATPEDRALIDAFLARVGALTPAEWGRLDAIGSRISGVTPLALLDRARLDGAAFGLWRLMPRQVATGTALAGRAAFWTAVGALTLSNLLLDPTLTGSRRRAEEAKLRAAQLEARHPELARTREDYRRLQAICAANPRPLGEGAIYTGAGRALLISLLALECRVLRPLAEFETLYALVEPVIPLTSLLPIPVQSSSPPTR